MPVTSVFDPETNGFKFINWGETVEFTWDLYQQTYLGINPNHDCVEAPLDCAFYEIYKNCAKNGNCSGISSLDLALFKYGGYMGFCSPANFYTGGALGPDEPDLHQAINVLHGRYFSAQGIQHFIDVAAAGQLNNADTAFNVIKAQLGNGDYAVLSIANSTIGDKAHTIIPYAIDESPSGFPAGTKLIYVWDSDIPYGVCPNYYILGYNRVVIKSAFDWEYNQGATLYPIVDYKGSNNGWCFAMPMSMVLHKARQPMTLDMAFDAITTIFMHGPGAAVTQIEDEAGHRFYTADADAHLMRDEIESSPLHGMPWAVRWPWFGAQPGGEPPGELYFLRRPPGAGQLKLTVRGTDYQLVHAQAGNLVQVQASGATRARDTLTIRGLAGPSQALELHTDGLRRGYSVQQLRLFSGESGWRSIHVDNARLNASGMHVQTLGDLQVVEVTGLERQVNFGVELQQYRQKALAKRPLGQHITAAGRALHFAPADWNDLERTPVTKKTFTRETGQPPKPGR